MNPDKYETANTNDHAFQARIALQQAEGNVHPTVAGITDPGRVQVALTQATLALVEETRTAALVAYLATLGTKDPKRPALEQALEIRLGFTTTPIPTRPIATAEQVKHPSAGGTSS